MLAAPSGHSSLRESRPTSPAHRRAVPGFLRPVQYPVRMIRTFTCQFCNASFTRDISVVVERKYCSLAHAAAARRLPASHRGATAEKLPCTRCKEVKPVADFDLHATTARGYQYWCRVCSAEARAERAKIPEDRTSIRRRKLREMYGITMAEYDAQFAAQEGRCAICGVQKDPWEPGVGLEGRKRFLTVDHCHVDGHIRGLLCASCNSGLGHFKDTLSVMIAAAEYIRNDMARALTVPAASPRAPGPGTSAPRPAL